MIAVGAERRVLVTGADGQVGKELSQLSWPSTVSTLFLNREGLDITDKGAVEYLVTDYQPDVIVNAAAYTAVDKAETEPEKARLVNETAVGYLASAADKVGAGLIHLSTDYVFDGLGSQEWYCEQDIPNPVNVYGETKLAGEAAALAAKRAIVLRTSGVYSVYGSNFVKTIRRLLERDQPLRVVNDQWNNPTAAFDIARVIFAIIQKNMHKLGLFHTASVEGATWWELANELVLLSASDQEVIKITTEEFPLPAQRPVDVRLSSAELAISYEVMCAPWRESVAKVSAAISERVV